MFPKRVTLFGSNLIPKPVMSRPGIGLLWFYHPPSIIGLGA